MKKSSSVKIFEENINKTIFKTIISKWYWFLLCLTVKSSAIYLVRNVIPQYEIPINVYAKESPNLLFLTITFIVLYKAIELILNNISDLVLRRSFSAASKELKAFLISHINKTKIHFLQEQGAPSIVNSFSICCSNYVGMLYTISHIVSDLIMVLFIFSIIYKNSKSLVCVSILWTVISVVTYLIITNGLGTLVEQAQTTSGKVPTLISNKVKNRQLEFFYCHDEKSLDLFSRYEENDLLLQEKINLRYQILNFSFNILLLGIQVLGFNLYLSHLLNSGKISISQFQDVFYANNAFCGTIVSNLLRNIPNVFKQYRDSEVFPNLLAPHLRPPIKNLAINKNPDIVVENVECLYSNKRILNSFSLNIPFGTKVAVVGVPGTGKTTLLNLLCSIVESSKGIIEVGNSDISQVSRESIAENFSYIFEEPNILPGTLRDNLTMGNEILGTEIKNALVEFGLEEWINKLDEELQEISVSHEERKTIMFLRTYLFVERTSIILADAPIEGMTGEKRIKAFEMLKRISHGKTVIVVDEDFVPFCDRVIFICNKRVQYGTHKDLLKKASYRAIFEEKELT